MADCGKKKVVVSDAGSSSANDGEYVTRSFNVPVTKLPSETKYPSDMLTLNYTLLDLRPQTLVLWHQKTCNLFSNGGGGMGSHLCERHYVQKITMNL